MAEVTTFEHASRCPRCDNVGVEQTDEQRPGPGGSTIHVLRCMNEACSWFDTDWIVQVNEDNTVPIRGRNEKTFPAMPGMTTEKALGSVSNIRDGERKRR